MTNSRYTITILALIISLHYGTLDLTENKFQIFSGYHFEKRPDLIPYEAVIPLLLKARLLQKPNVEKFKNNLSNCSTHTNSSNAYCEAQQNLVTLQSLLNKQINYSFTEEAFKNVNNGNRTRRGIVWIGDFLKFCCDVANTKQISGLYDNQKQLQTHENEIITSVATQYRNLVATTKSLSNFTQDVQHLTDKMHNSLKLIRDELNKIRTSTNINMLGQIYALTQQSWTYILYNYLHDMHRSILEKCHFNILAEELINPEDLAMELHVLQRKANIMGLRLAIPENRLDLYYKLKITSCKIFNDTLLVRLNIPLVNTETQGEFFKAITTPVLWEDMICNLHAEDNFIFKTSRYSKMIKATEEECGKNSNPLCMLPRQTSTTQEQYLCIHHILNSEKIVTLQKYCQYSCLQKPENPVITQLLPHKYLVTNIHTELTLVCDNQTDAAIAPITAGTVEITIPCFCELRLLQNILITKKKPCDEKELKQSHLVNLIPAMWSKLQSLKLFKLETGIRHEFQNLSELLDSNWTLNNPTFKITTMKKITPIKLRNNEYDIFTDTRLLFYILSAWTSILTLIIMVLIYCLHIQSLKIKFLLPRKDYAQNADH